MASAGNPIIGIRVDRALKAALEQAAAAKGVEKSAMIRLWLQERVEAEGFAPEPAAEGKGTT